MKLGTDIHGAQRITFQVFGDALTFLLAVPAGKLFTLPVKYFNIRCIDLITFSVIVPRLRIPQDILDPLTPPRG